MELRKRAARAALALSLLLAAVACDRVSRPASGSSPRASVRPTPLLSIPPVSPSPSSSRLKVEKVAEFIIPDETASFGCVFGNFVAWGGGNTGTGDPNTIMIRDLTTGITKLVARADKLGGVTDWPRGSGDNLIYTDQDPGNETSEYNDFPWRIYHVDLKTNQRRLLEESGPGVRAVFPSPQISGTRVIWFHGGRGDSITGDLIGLDLATGKRRTLVRRIQAEDYGIDGDDVVYSRATAQGIDLFRTSFTRPDRPVRLTTHGKVRRANIGHGLIAYEYGVYARDPESIWVMPIRGGAPRRVSAKNYPSNITAGRNLVAWWSSSGTRSAFIDDPTNSVYLQSEDDSSVPTRLDWDGDRLLYGEVKRIQARDVITLHVVRITRS